MEMAKLGRRSRGSIYGDDDDDDDVSCWLTYSNNLPSKSPFNVPRLLRSTALPFTIAREESAANYRRYRRADHPPTWQDPGPPRPQPVVPLGKLERMASAQAARSFI